MIRWGVLAAGAAVVAGAAFVTGSSIPPKPAVDLNKPAEVKAVIGQKTGYFNMAKVMREYRKAQTAVARLNDRKNRMTANLIGLRAMALDVQTAAQRATLPSAKFDLEHDLRMLQRFIEDGDREVAKLLNNQASVVIGELYDEIRSTVAELATEHGLHAVLAYPAAVTREDAENPLYKELMLKPPAALPFYVDPSVEYTDELLQRLNAKFAADNGEK